jgi:hypothetical protein
MEKLAPMEKLVADTQTAPPRSMTAAQYLQTCQKFARGRVDGLKKLIASFTALYSTMPDTRKKIAGKVAHQTAAAHG